MSAHTTPNASVSVPSTPRAKQASYFPESLFKVEVFKTFDDKEFIENLTYRLLNEAKKTPPSEQTVFFQQFEDLFSQSIAQLGMLQTEVNGTVEKLIKQTEEASAVHKEKLQLLNEEIDVISEKFKSLEDCISKVGNTTVQIGNTLETLDKQKKRAFDAKRLMQYFNEFNKYDPVDFETNILPKRKMAHNIFTSPKRMHEAAKLIQQLSLIAKDLTRVKDCKNGIANIDKYSQSLLQTLTTKFTKATILLEHRKEVALSRLKEVALILSDFSNVDVCIRIFIEKRFEVFLGLIYPMEEGLEDEDKQSLNERDEEEQEKSENDKNKSAEDEKTDDKKEEDEDDKSDKDQQDKEHNDNQEDDSEDKSQHENEKSGADDDIQFDDEFEVHDVNDADLDNDGPLASSSSTQQQIIVTAFQTPKKIQPLPEELVISPEQQRLSDLNQAFRNMIQGVKSATDFAKLMQQIVTSIQNDYAIIQEIFTSGTKEVMLKFLAKVLDELLKTVVQNTLISPSLDSDRLAILQYLKTFEQIYSECMKFIKTITTGDVSLPEQEAKELFENLFTDKKEKYIQIEITYLQLLFDAKIQEIKEEEDRVEAAIKQSLLENKQKQGLFGMLGPNAQGADTLQKPCPLQLDVVVSLLHENSGSLKRCKNLSPSSKIANNFLQIFDILIRFIGQYASKGVLIGNQSLESAPPKSIPKNDFFNILQLANSILQYIQRHLENMVLPTVSVSLPIQLQCVKIKDDLFSELESKVMKGLDLMLKYSLDYLKYVLETIQNKGDYKTNEKNLSWETSHHPTKACSTCCDFLEKHLSYVDKCLFGRNREVYLKELGTEFYNVLTNVMKSMTVNATGALKLMRDLSEYNRIIHKFNITSLEDQFDVLRELSNLFLVAPSTLENVLSELANNRKIPREEIVNFVKMRADFKSAKLSKLPFLQITKAGKKVDLDD